MSCTRVSIEASNVRRGQRRSGCRYYEYTPSSIVSNHRRLPDAIPHLLFIEEGSAREGTTAFACTLSVLLL
jgi:hypothetical protein